MVRYGAKPDESRRRSWMRSLEAARWLPAVLIMSGPTSGTMQTTPTMPTTPSVDQTGTITAQVRPHHHGMAAAAHTAAHTPPEPFKVTNIHFETNASACDMGIQIKFDTEGLTAGSIKDPNGRMIYGLRSSGGMKATGGQTEGFLEAVEPQITELVSALGCAPSTEEGTSSLDDLFKAFPAGDYTFSGQAKGTKLGGKATLTHLIPAGPDIVAPTPGMVVPDAPLLIDWDPVTDAILPSLGPVNIVGYHVIVEEAGAEVTPELDVDLPATETSVTVPAEYLKPSTVYRFEVLSTEEGGNQTISEGFFCTVGVASCVVPE